MQEPIKQRLTSHRKAEDTLKKACKSKANLLSGKKKYPVSCDWRSGPDRRKKGGKTENRSRLHRFRKNYSWSGIEKERYKRESGDWADVVRQTLIGGRGETTKFHLRYFEIAPGGRSSFEKHKHEHVVIVVRGKGICAVGERRLRLDFLDTLYIEPNAPHQLRNPYKEPFGFFCVVNARRDRPKLLPPDK